MDPCLMDEISSVEIVELDSPTPVNSRTVRAIRRFSSSLMKEIIAISSELFDPVWRCCPCVEGLCGMELEKGWGWGLDWGRVVVGRV